MTRITADAGLSVEELFAKYPAKSAHDATLMGCEWFFTGRPCKSGHVAPRAKSNGTCCKCLYAWNDRYREEASVKSHACARALLWYAKNTTRAKDGVAQWQRRNPEKIRGYSHKTRANRSNAEGTHVGADIDLLYRVQEGRCAYCDTDLSTGYHVDHFNPLSKGGTNWPDNLRLSCPKCNLRKHNKLPEVWMLEVASWSCANRRAN
jgi:5-methylcytosine-specific restriction endonuclease McrA